jgi:hypothetical protein
MISEITLFDGILGIAGVKFEFAAVFGGFVLEF